MATQNYTVTGMTCEHCENAVREEVGELTGVTAVDVSRTDGHLTVTADTEVADADVLAAVEEAGYTPERA